MFLLGLMLNSNGRGFNPDIFRIPGVLQRFSISYLFVGIMGLLMTPKDITPPPESVYSINYFKNENIIRLSIFVSLVEIEDRFPWCHRLVASMAPHGDCGGRSLLHHFLPSSSGLWLPSRLHWASWASFRRKLHERVYRRSGRLHWPLDPYYESYFSISFGPRDLWIWTIRSWGRIR